MPLDLNIDEKTAAPAPAPAAAVTTEAAPAEAFTDDGTGIFDAMAAEITSDAGGTPEGVNMLEHIGVLLNGSETPSDPAGSVAPGQPSPKAAAPAPGISAKEIGIEGIEMSVDIYIALLEGITNVLCGMLAKDEQMEFVFEKKMKATYRNVAIIYAKQQQIKVSPGMLFFAATLFLVGGAGFKAWKRRKEVVKIERIREKKTNGTATAKEVGQIALFDSERAAPKRRFFEVDENNLYTKTEDGTYIKQASRTERMPPELIAWVDAFTKQHGDRPKNATIIHYLKTRNN